MAKAGCWEPTCDFTGSRTRSDANPGRCTKTAGYVAAAEINEIIKRGDGAQIFHDAGSDTDVMLYKGDYVSYMTPTSKDMRRAQWKSLNFAGTIDWAVDLQSFTADDMDALPKRPLVGEGCVSGEDDSVNSGDLCAFSCALGFCPESLCTCVSTGPMQTLPADKPDTNVIAWDEFDVDLNRLCKFACKYDHCPDDVCTTPSVESDDEVNMGFDYDGARNQNAWKCLIYKDTLPSESARTCEPVCRDVVDKAKAEGKYANYGCGANFPLDQDIPWTKYPGTQDLYVPGHCVCDDQFVDILANFTFTALSEIAQIACYVLMSSVKLVLDAGLDFIPGPGKVLEAGLDGAITLAKTAAYIYDKEQDPEGAFEWWLSPCGGTDLVPEDFKKAFGILNQFSDGVSSYRPPKTIKKGSGKKGDDGNPTDRPKSPPGKGGKGGKGGTHSSGRPKCEIPKSKETLRIGPAKNTLRVQSCSADMTVRKEMIITSIVYAANAAPTEVKKECDQAWSQACFHYSSAIRVNPQWATLTCPPSAGTASRPRPTLRATDVWSRQHKGSGWNDAATRGQLKCDRDEFPPAYLLDNTHPAFINSGLNSQGQLIRYLPAAENQRAGQMWKGACFEPLIKDLSNQDFMKDFAKAKSPSLLNPRSGVNQAMAAVTLNTRPVFVISSWGHSAMPPTDDGLRDNPCWPKAKAALDPAFVLLTYDPRYGGQAPPYGYGNPYVKGSNGS